MDQNIAIDFISNATIISITVETGMIQLHDSLRCAADSLSISHTTLSKAFKNTDICSVKSKTNGVIIFRRLHNIYHND